MLIDAFWFNNTQSGNAVLQPEFFTPKTYLGLYSEGDFSQFPIHVNIKVIANKSVVYEKDLTISEAKIQNGEYVVMVDNVNGSIFMQGFC